MFQLSELVLMITELVVVSELVPILQLMDFHMLLLFAVVS